MWNVFSVLVWGRKLGCVFVRVEVGEDLEWFMLSFVFDLMGYWGLIIDDGDLWYVFWG